MFLNVRKPNLEEVGVSRTSTHFVHSPWMGRATPPNSMHVTPGLLLFHDLRTPGACQNRPRETLEVRIREITHHVAANDAEGIDRDQQQEAWLEGAKVFGPSAAEAGAKAHVAVERMGNALVLAASLYTLAFNDH